MRLIFAVLLGKLISFLTKSLKIGGGSAAPGLYALRIEPDLLTKLSSKIAKNVVITGTNGKTTTAKMLTDFAKKQGLKVIRNKTGSNLERGIVSTLIQTSGNFDLGIWELDEAAFNTVSPKLKPDVIVFLNVFRDQLDRYGEIDTVVKNWAATLKKMPSNTAVLVNGDDSNTLKLASFFSGKVQKFGVRDYKIHGENTTHLKEKASLDFEVLDVRLNGLKGSRFSLKNIKFTLPLPGLYHIYDALAALSAADLLGFPLRTLAAVLNKYVPAFGRVEKLPFGYIFLIKNPAGTTQVLETITPNLKPGDRLMIALNDNLADGTDVSWIWDAGFEKLGTLTGISVICTGIRAHELALRLKYAGFDQELITVNNDLQDALRQAGKGLKGKLFILPTYTAMLKLQSILAGSGFKKEYWEYE